MKIGELFRRVKFGTIRPARHVLTPGYLSVFAHLAALRNWLDRGDIDLVIDVGGNIGQFASALRYMGYTGDIISFEPVPEVYAALARRMNSDRRWHGRQIAIGNYAGEAMFNVMADLMLSSFLSWSTPNKNANDTMQKRLPVQIRTLANIIDEMDLVFRLPRTLLKSDTQGYEMPVLQGLGGYINQIKLVLCEVSSVPLYDGEPFMTEVIDFLNEHHFNLISFAPVSGDSETPVHFDYLCVNQKISS